jgi:hypothetical protein
MLMPGTGPIVVFKGHCHWQVTFDREGGRCLEAGPLATAGISSSNSRRSTPMPSGRCSTHSLQRTTLQMPSVHLAVVE